jgi:hypothetical protein
MKEKHFIFEVPLEVPTQFPLKDEKPLIGEKRSNLERLIVTEDIRKTLERLTEQNIIKSEEANITVDVEGKSNLSVGGSERYLRIKERLQNDGDEEVFVEICRLPIKIKSDNNN